jgi:cupin fold WbuC family metalloprotein
MINNDISMLSTEVIEDYKKLAISSEKRRFPKLLHSAGDEFNRVFNFMMHDSYMQPHLHPGKEKIENIYLIYGRIASIFFDEVGNMQSYSLLEHGSLEFIEVPAFTWHTYIILSDFAITYETMMGIYNPTTWKKFANWAPQEGTLNSKNYLESLKNNINL